MFTAVEVGEPGGKRVEDSRGRDGNSFLPAATIERAKEGNPVAEDRAAEAPQ